MGRDMSTQGKNVAILGCTGSIGDTCFKVLDNLQGEFEIIGLSGGAQEEKLIQRALSWRPSQVCVMDQQARQRVRSQIPEAEVLCGAEGLIEIATNPEVELVLNGLVGAIGLPPTMAALAAEAALERPLALIMAAPRCCTTGMKSYP